MSDVTQTPNDEPRRHFAIGDYRNVSRHIKLTPSTSLFAIAASGMAAGGVAAMMFMSSLPSSDGSPGEMAVQTSAQESKSDVTIDYAEVVQHAHTVKSQLDQERAARIAAEEKATQAARHIEDFKHAHALAQTAAAQESARLESVKVARQTSADLDLASRETSTSKAAVSTPAGWDAQVSVSTAATSAPPEPLPQKNVVVAPLKEQPTHAAEAKSMATQRLQVAAKSSDNGHAELLAGQKHLSAGNLTAARHAFERAAQLGRPEGALAVGNTFDPVSLAKIGVRTPGDTVRARLWYRRAYDIALSQQQKLGQQNP